ncbi:MSHA biogenesis protein MshG [hydrothermal vent metagenome]|uniref:MSHA biogenesis protein MshG n=1 Tax=hydrothermal vent metagenome TaxID=652676 RepID=A0A3B1E7A0_9ZZZZ
MSKIKIWYQEKQKLKYKTANSQVSFELPPNVIKIEKIKKLTQYIDVSFSSYNNVVNIFEELSIILNTNLALNDALTILIKGNRDLKMNTILYSMKRALENGKPISFALERYRKYIGYLPILFFDLGYANGNIKESISALSIILKENQKTKKQFVEALSYPFVLLATLLISIVLIFNFVIPRFEHMFAQFGSNLPLATQYLLATQSFFENQYMFIIFFICCLAVLLKYYMYKEYEYIDKILVCKLPIISKLYKNFILHRFFLALTMLVASKYRFQIALEGAKPIVKNKFIIHKIKLLINDIHNGYTVADAFERTDIFNDITIRLLYTGQQTNTIDTVLSNITNIYKQQLSSKIKYFSKTIGPFFIMIISIFILWLVFALMLPIWNLGSILK